MRRVYINLLSILMLFYSNLVIAAPSMKEPLVIPNVFTVIEKPIALTPSSIFYNQSMEKTILENIENRFIIVHFWATWCMDCSAELIALNNLQKEFRKKALLVMAISEDFRGVEAIDAYLTKYKIDYLDIYLDKKNKVYQSLMLNHLPVTYLIDTNGKVIAMSTPGKPTDWSDPLVKDYLEEKVSKYQLLPPEYKKIRDKYESPKAMDKKK